MEETDALPIAKRRLLHIEWMDASSRPGAWSYTADIDFDHPFLVWTVGWLIAETKTHLHMAASMSFPKSTDNEQLGGVISIPKGMVRRTQRLTTFPPPDR